MKNLNQYFKPLLISSALFCSAGAAAADPDFERIHKDVTVMSNIIKGAFEADDSCRGCQPRIDSSYLANQGAVFTIRLNSWRSFQTVSGNNSNFSFVVPAPDEVKHIEITEVVSDVLDNLGSVMDDVGSRIEFKMSDLENHETLLRIDSEARRALRELNRERRDLEYERREYEIELIHADEDTRRDIERQISELEKGINTIEMKQSELNKAYEAERKERELARQAKREKAIQQAEAQLAAVEDVVIRSLCDYGATLKNIPEKEHVSLLFEQNNEDQTKVFVMDMNDVQGCQKADVLRSDATVYKF